MGSILIEVSRFFFKVAEFSQLSADVKYESKKTNIRIEMSERLATRQAISALLDAGKTPTVIAADLGCSRVTVYRVKK